MNVLERRLQTAVTSSFKVHVGTRLVYAERPAKADVVRQLWDEFCTLWGVELPIRHDVLSLILRSEATMLRQLLANARSVVTLAYGLALDRRHRAANKDKVARLLAFDAFVFKEPGLRSGIYCHPSLMLVFQKTWFGHARAMGVTVAGSFNEITPQCIALMLTAVEAALTEWKSGAFVRTKSLNAGRWRGAWKRQLDALITFQDKCYAIGEPFFVQWEEDMLHNARVSAGVEREDVTAEVEHACITAHDMDREMLTGYAGFDSALLFP